MARAISIEPDDVIFSKHSLNWGLKKSESNDEGNLLVIHAGSAPTEFRDESMIFQSLSRSLAREFVSIYAPTDNLDAAYDSDAGRIGLQEEIEGIMDDVLGARQDTQEAS